MGKDKLRRFRENLTFECFVQPEFDEVFRRDHPLKGNWNRDFFRNDNPIVLELGCGKGEYTVALAQRDPLRNYIGIDIKGARMWRGAKTATDRRMHNVGFLRTRIEFIDALFAEGEVSEADIDGSGFADEVLSVKTAYETRFLEMGLPITYTRFALGGRREFPWFDWEEDDKAEKDNEAERQLR